MNSDRPDSSRPDDPDPGLDVDAAFAEIVAHWGPPPAEPETVDPEPVDPEPAPPQPDQAGEGPPSEPDPARLRGLFRPAWQDGLDSDATWDDEGHFVPPPPPPLPPIEPRRRWAWAGLVGFPLVALLVVVLDLSLPGWLVFLLGAGFVGGFVYLVATMRSGPPDGMSGDDGAVV